MGETPQGHKHLGAVLVQPSWYSARLCEAFPWPLCLLSPAPLFLVSFSSEHFLPGDFHFYRNPLPKVCFWGTQSKTCNLEGQLLLVPGSLLALKHHLEPHPLCCGPNILPGGLVLLFVSAVTDWGPVKIESPPGTNNTLYQLLSILYESCYLLPSAIGEETDLEKMSDLYKSHCSSQSLYLDPHPGGSKLPTFTSTCALCSPWC